MRRSIGLRVQPDRIWLSVVEADQTDRLELLVSTYLPIPRALHPPSQLRFARQAIADTIAEYQVVFAGIRLAEPIAKSVDRARLHIEGVLQELLSSSSVRSYFYGPIASIARLMHESDRSAIKRYIDGSPFRELPGWSQMTREQRESTLVAVAAHSLES